MKDRKETLAVQLDLFVRVYTQETEHLKEKEGEMVNDGGDRLMNEDKFQPFAEHARLVKYMGLMLVSSAEGL